MLRTYATALIAALVSANDDASTAIIADKVAHAIPTLDSADIKLPSHQIPANKA